MKTFILFFQLIFALNAFAADTAAIVSIDRQGWYVSGYIQDSSADTIICTSCAASSTFTEITDANLSLTLDSGSAPAEIPCVSGTASSGLTCPSTESVGIVFTPPASGVYEVCSTALLYGDAQTANWGVTLGHIETSNTSSTAITAPSNLGLHRLAGEETNGLAYSPQSYCSLHTFSDTSKKTIRLERKLEGSGTASIYLLSTNVNDRRVHFSVRRRVEYADAVKFTNLVTAPNLASGLKIKTVNFDNGSANVECSTADCRENYPTGESPWATVTFNSTGNYSVAITGFALPPHCWFQSYHSASDRRSRIASITASGFNLFGYSGNVIADNLAGALFCIGQ